MRYIMTKVPEKGAPTEAGAVMIAVALTVSVMVCVVHRERLVMRCTMTKVLEKGATTEAGAVTIAVALTVVVAGTIERHEHADETF